MKNDPIKLLREKFLIQQNQRVGMMEAELRAGMFTAYHELLELAEKEFQAYLSKLGQAHEEERRARAIQCKADLP